MHLNDPIAGWTTGAIYHNLCNRFTMVHANSTNRHNDTRTPKDSAYEHLDQFS